MQLENIGYAEKRWLDLFVDASMCFRNRIGEAVDLARARGISALLYQFSSLHGASGLPGVLL